MPPGTSMLPVMSPQADDGVGHGGRFGLHVDGNAPVDGRGFAGGKHPGGLDDGLGRDVGDGGDLVDGVFLDPFLQLVKAVGPLLHECLVVEVFVDDHVQHAEGEGAARAGPQLQVMVRAAGHPGVAGIDGDDLGSQLHAVHDPVAHKGVRAAVGRVLSPDQNHLGPAPGRVVVPLFQELGTVRDGKIAHDRMHGAQPGGVAGLARETELAPVGAAEAVGEK